MDDLTLANLLRLEHDGWQSLCRGQGGDFYGELMTPDAVMVLARQRAEWIAAGTRTEPDPQDADRPCCADNGAMSAG